MPVSAHRLRNLGIWLGVFLVGSLFCPPATVRAEGEDPAAIERVTNLNKKAIDAYNNLEFEDARKLLKQALELCGSSGLDRHPIKARTHIHMGVVLIATKQQELGIKQFRKALEIQPDIQVTKAMANPEIMEAFEEARAGGSAEGGDTGGSEAGAGTGGPAAAGGTESPAAGDITHVPVSRGGRGRAIGISVSVSPNLTGYTKVVLAYRQQGGREFLARDMRRAGNRWSAEIPADATKGSVVHYYVEAESDDETAIATTGSEDRPYAISLVAGGGAGGGEEEDDDDDVKGGRLFVSLLGGTGIGYATGNGEVNADNKVNSGFAPSSAAQIVPEVGYFLTPNLRLSVQLRYQIVSGATAQNLNSYKATLPPERQATFNVNACGSDFLCSPATYALAVFARASWFFGSAMIRPYFSLALGAGAVRHIVKFTSLKTSTAPGTCGKDGKQACVDTVLAGPVFAGPGGGVLVSLTPMFGVVGEIGTVLGLPKFTYHLDFNIGVAARF